MWLQEIKMTIVYLQVCKTFRMQNCNCNSSASRPQDLPDETKCIGLEQKHQEIAKLAQGAGKLKLKEKEKFQKCFSSL